MFIVLKHLLNHKISLFENHRNVQPIVNANKKKYAFFNIKWIVKVAKLPYYLHLSKNTKLSSNILYCLLRLIKPSYIIGCNWITPQQKVYYTYSRKNDCQFIVVQHGAYLGGVISEKDKDHRYIYGDRFLVWGNYFKNLFDCYNPTRKNDVVVFGNPVYNMHSRDIYNYPSRHSKILFAPSLMNDETLASYEQIFKILLSSKQNVFIKYHNQQKDKFSSYIDREVNGSFASIVEAYDLIIADHSTTILDAIYFKKSVIFISNIGCQTTYEQFLSNHFHSLHNKQLTLKELIDHNAQEKLFKYMITLKDNNLFDALQC